MNIYKKLIQARYKLQMLELKKSGHNKFAGYQYFELGDFLPAIQKIFDTVGLVDVISFTADLATMTIYDVEDGSSIVFTSPMGSAALKGCHEVQNIGAVETYQRRYLYVTALAIVEHDAIDSSEAVVEKSVVEKTTAITPQQISSINALIEQTSSDMGKLCDYFKKPNLLLFDRHQATNAIAMLQKKLGTENVN
jgi:hypothetical protein